MAAAKARPPRAGTRSRPGACRRSATAPARSASRRTATSCAAVGVGRAGADGQVHQEGPVGPGTADAADRAHERERREAHGQDLVARIDDLPRDGRPHDRRSRRPQARAGVRDGGDGRPQARRVCAHAAVPRPRRLRPHGSDEVGMADEKEKQPKDETAPKPKARRSTAAKKAASAKEEKPKRTRTTARKADGETKAKTPTRRRAPAKPKPEKHEAAPEPKGQPKEQLKAAEEPKAP